MSLRGVLLGLGAALAPAVSSAQHYQTEFPPEEFKARWAKVFDASAPTRWPSCRARR